MLKFSCTAQRVSGGEGEGGGGGGGVVGSVGDGGSGGSRYVDSRSVI